MKSKETDWMSKPPNMTNSPREIATIGEAADHFKCSVRTIERLIAAEAVPVLRIGRLVRLDLNELEGLFHQPGSLQREFQQ